MYNRIVIKMFSKRMYLQQETLVTITIPDYHPTSEPYIYQHIQDFS